MVDNGFNNVTDRFAYPFEVFNGKLYVSVRNDIDGTGLWRTSDGQNWEQANIDGMAPDMYQRDRDMIRQLKFYHGYLYAIVRNDTLGVGNWWIEVWRSPNGTDWTQVGENGLGEIPIIIMTAEGLRYITTVCILAQGELRLKVHGFIEPVTV